MRPYLALFSARARLLFQYRIAAFAGLATQIFWGVMRIMILTAFYQSTTSLIHVPISLADTITYIWLSQALLSLLPWNLDRELEQLVRSGNVVFELTKPLSLYAHWYCRAMAMRLVPSLLRIVPMVVIASLFFGLSWPASSASAALFAIALLGTLFLSAAFTTLVMTSMFWTITGEGIARLLPAVMLITTGMLVPLPLYPDWIQPILWALPFRGLIDTPFRLYLGHIPPSEAWIGLLHQWVWIALLVIFGRWLMHRATRRLVVHGG